MSSGGRMSRLIRPLRQWTVRSRIVAALALLAAVGLLTVDLAGMTLLHSYLVRRVDQQLERNVSRARFLPPEPIETRPRLTTAFGPDFRVYRFDADGRLVETAASGDRPDPDLGSLAELQRHADAGKPYTVEGSTSAWRVEVVRLSSGQGYFASAVSLRDVQDTEERMLLINIGVSAVALLLMGGAAASVVRMGLRPLTRMEATAEEIAAGDLSRRVADADPHTEAGRLGTALNAMLARIEEAVAHRAESERRMRRLLADAAHELRTPLTSVQGFAELYRRGGAPPGPALDEAMACIETDVRRMRRLVDDLLLLARLDEERPPERRPVDLLAVAAGAVRDAHVRLPHRFVRLASLDDRQATFEPVTVLGDEVSGRTSPPTSRSRPSRSGTPDPVWRWPTRSGCSSACTGRTPAARAGTAARVLACPSSPRSCRHTAAGSSSGRHRGQAPGSGSCCPRYRRPRSRTTG